MSKKTQLKPCPFCGGVARTKGARYNLYGSYGSREDERQWYGVYCASCLIGQPSRKYHEREESVNAWNGRVCNEQ